MLPLVLVIVAALVALTFAAFNFTKVKKMEEGTDKMSEIAAAIRVGANAFIMYEYKIIAMVVVIIAVLFVIFTFIPPRIPLFKDPITNTYGYFQMI